MGRPVVMMMFSQRRDDRGGANNRRGSGEEMTSSPLSPKKLGSTLKMKTVGNETDGQQTKKLKLKT